MSDIDFEAGEEATIRRCVNAMRSTQKTPLISAHKCRLMAIACARQIERSLVYAEYGRAAEWLGSQVDQEQRRAGGKGE